MYNTDPINFLLLDSKIKNKPENKIPKIKIKLENKILKIEIKSQRTQRNTSNKNEPKLRVITSQKKTMKRKY